MFLYGMCVVSVHVYVWRPKEDAVTLEGKLLIQRHSYKVVGFQLTKLLVFMAEISRRLHREEADTQSSIGLEDGVVMGDGSISFPLSK